jgi:hypothetical protein
MPRKKKPIHRIVDRNGNIFIPPQHEKYRGHLERLRDEDKKKSIQSWSPNPDSTIMDGPYLSARELLAKGLQPFELFDFWTCGLQPIDPLTKEEILLLDGPDIEQVLGRKKYPSEQKRRAVTKLLSCVYRVEDLLKFPELAALIGEENDVGDKHRRTQKQQETKTTARTLSCQAGTTWDKIKITAISDGAVMIDAPGCQERLTYGQLGFAKKKNPDRAVRSWEILLDFCQGRGIVSLSGKDDGYYKQVSDLNRALKGLFGINSSFLRKGKYQRGEGYVASISFFDHRDMNALRQRKLDSRYDDLMESMAEDIQRR